MIFFFSKSYEEAKYENLTKLFSFVVEELSPPASLHTSTATVKSPGSSTSQPETEGEESLTGTDHDVTSGTSTDGSDHDIAVEDLSHDDSAEHIQCRERRDSGVGSSLTRAPR